jgi:amino acid adenylation domain-containing protein
MSTLITRIFAAGLSALDQPAVVAADTTLSYRTLLASARATAESLRGIGVEQPIGVATRRDSRYLVSALGILAAGGCFVPLDVTLPRARLAALVERAGVRLALAGPGDLDGVVERVRPPVLAESGAEGVEPAGAADALAYQLFTSGSTGTPKVVAIEQRSVCALVDGFDAVAPPRRRVVSSAVCPFSFDVSIWELFAPLLAGGTVHLLDGSIAADPERLVRTIVEHGITTAYLPPYGLELVARVLADTGPGVLDRVLVGVEPIPQRTLARLLEVAPGLAIVNGYGPTETTICATFHRFTGTTEPDRRTPIGKAVPGWTVRTDASGEILVAGAGLARGYVGEASDRFVEVDGVRWYRTGDVGRWLDSGELEFVGRLDDQVKLSGFRVELGEVEAAMAGVPGVRHAVACAPDGPGGRRLVGFVVGDKGLAGAAVRRAVSGVLPEYAVPARVVVVDSFPLTANGKVDRLALLAAEASSPVSGEGLAGLWGEVLGVSEVGPEDDFFDLGGDSRLALVLAGEVLKRFDTEASPGRLLACRTVAEMSRLIGKPCHIVALEGKQRHIASPLSVGQEGLLTWQRMHPDALAFVLPVAVRVRVGCPADTLRDAVAAVLARHEAFSVRFGISGGTEPPRIEVDAEPVPAGRLDDRLTEAHRAAAQLIVGLADAPWRVRIVPVEGGDQVFLLSVHHVVFDGTSVRTLTRDLAASLAGEPLAPAEFAVRQNTGWAAEREYWQQELTPLPEALELPLDRGRTGRHADDGRTRCQVLGPDAARALDLLAKRHRTSRFTVLLAALGAIAARYSGQRDFALATVTALDRAAGHADAIGYFANLLPIRFALEPGETFSSTVDTTAARLRNALASGALPFEEILSVAGGPQHAARFTRMVVAQDVGSGLPLRAGDFQLDEQDVDPATAKYELCVFLNDQPELPVLRWEYATDLFDDATIERLASALERLLISDADQPVDRIPLTSEVDRRLLAEANRTETAYPATASIIDLFDEQVARYPDAIAVESPVEKLSYRALDERTRVLAGALSTKGVRPGDAVIVLTERTAEFPLAVLGVLRCGACYVPIDARNPAERVALIASMLGVRHAVASARLVERLPAGVAVIHPGAEGGGLKPAPRGPESVAYVMFTSGSTGTPKGVEIPDRAVIRLVRNQNFAEFGHEDAFILASNLAFDAATLELWGSLLNGGRLVIPEDAAVRDPRELAGAIRRHGVTAGFFNVSVFRMMITASPAELRGMHTILVGGEAVPAALLAEAARHLDYRTLVNGYGPTENTTFSCCYRLEAPPDRLRTVPIGRPIANSTAMVVDQGFHPVGVGVVGEIVVGGAGLARGYVGGVGSDRFVEVDGVRWYRTGDLGRWLASGVLECVGRLDDQVKVGGFRVELGEVEAALVGVPGVRQAVVCAPTGAGGRRRLGFVVGDKGLDGSWVRRRLLGVLPDYAVPARVTVVDSFPLTANGKVDRTALLTEPERDVPPAATPGSGVVGGLVGLWREVLEVPDVGVQDNFFELGGDSRLLVVLTERVRQTFDRPVRVVDLMAHPTVGQLAEFLGADREPETVGAAAAHRAALRGRRRR